MPVMSKTWQFDTNRVNPDAATSQNAGVAYLLWYIKQFLTGQLGGATQGLWSIYYSCDGTTAGTPGDGIDRWTTQANVVFSTTLNGARSWMVLKSPVLPNGMRNYLFLQAQNWTGSAAVAGNANIFTMKTAPTGGLTTSEPAFTDQVIHRSSGANTAMFALQSTTAARRIHAGLTSDGATMYFISGANGAGYCEFAFIWSLLSQAKSADPYPFYQFGFVNAASPGPLTTQYLNTTNVSSCSLSRSPNGSAVYQAMMVWPSVSNNYASTASYTTGADPIDTSYMDFPAYIGWANITSGSAGTPGGGQQVRGLLPDFAIAPDVVAQGTVDGPGGSITSAKIGSLWVPIATAPLM